ncbi:LacI family DNA-binding transcriptional regulator [Cellulomonas endophytica]|uniref:LacI family DNA-binding transcriptional regulator n=1 Tax=Cellulomonas endophytica TaxID=2494735 RepID=UPI001F0BEA4E|nr:LacI family DNA-binding transcriptional regulator [Cellulomonas endophytica]
MRDVAARAGVSGKTVSRVHTGDPHVAPETRARVQRALDELGYLPNALATTFRDGRSAVIGVVVPDVEDPFFAAVVQQVDRTAAAGGMLTIVAGTGQDPAAERARVQTLLSRRLAGLVLAPVSDDQSYLRPWARSTPVVLVDRRPSRLTADSFASDDEHGAHRLTAHLVEHGHRAVAFLGDTAALPTTAARLAGHRRALAETGLPERPELVAMEGADREGAAAAVAALRALPDPPTALLSSNARCTMALAPLLADLGMAVVSFGDFPLSDALVPGVTVLDQHPRRLGELAATRVLDRLAHPERRFRRRETVPATLVERASCTLPS